MKRLTLLFTAVVTLLLVTITSCGYQQKRQLIELRKEIDAANAQCPMQVEPFGKILSIEYDEDNHDVVVTMAFNDEQVDFSFDNKEHESMVKEALGLSFASSEMKELIDKIIGAGANLTYKIKQENGSKSFTCEFSNEELGKLAHRQISDKEIKRRSLELNVKMANSTCPMTVDEITTMTSIRLEGTELVYNAEIAEDGTFVVSDMESVKDEIKQEMLGELMHDYTMRKIMQPLRELGYGMKYVYTGTQSGTSLEVVISPEELSSAME